MRNLLIVLCVFVSVTTQAQHNSAQSLSLSESLTLTHPGEFTNKKANEYFTSLIGGCNSSSNFFDVQSNYLTDAFDACITVPSSSTAVNSLAIVGMANNYTTGGAKRTAVGAGYFQGIGFVGGAATWGINTLVTMHCASPCTGGSIIGYESDIGPGTNTAPRQILGIQMGGGCAPPCGTVPSGSNATAIIIEPVSWSWHYGLAFNRGATDTYGIFLDGAAPSGNSGSQTIGFQSWNAGHPIVHVMYQDGSGNLNITGSGYRYKTIINEGLMIHGDLQVDGNVLKGGGSFQIDHPLDPANKYLYHSFVESPDMMNVYNGNVVTNNRGLATVVLPDYFEALNRDFRYQLTVIGQFAQAIVAKKIGHNRFVIRTSKPNVEVSWQVTGIRQDAYANAHRIQVEEEKPPREQGHYLHPELFGATEKEAIGATSPPAMTLPVTTAVTN